jgi:3-hydroxyacyl-[acyl-carrier-protein] dehydratase
MSADGAPAVDPRQVLDLLPHRYPFLLVDRVEAFEKDATIHATKNVTFNEPYFAGHFPGNPVMPGVLQVEALAQAAALLAMLSRPELVEAGGGVLLMGLDKVRFRRMVVPGDVLSLHVTVTKIRGDIWKVKGQAQVAGERAAEADILATFVGPDARG